MEASNSHVAAGEYRATLSRVYICIHIYIYTYIHIYVYILSIQHIYIYICIFIYIYSTRTSGERGTNPECWKG